MNLLIFSISIIVSSIGVTLDHISTKRFMSDIGKKFETNTIFIKIIEKNGYKKWIIFEAIVILVFGLSDFTLNILLWGLFWGVGRGLAAAHNFQIISEYQTIGISAFKENSERRKHIFQSVSRISRYKMRLQYFVLLTICIVLMFSIFLIAYESMFQVDLLLISIVEGLIFGISGFFLNMAIID